MTQISVPIVGMHFRPPAKVLAKYLPAGAKLMLVPEPENPYDEMAVRVEVAWANLGEEEMDEGIRRELREDLEAFSFTIEECKEKEIFHLGYLAAKPPKGMECQFLAKDVFVVLQGQPGEAKLSFTPDGKLLALARWGATK